jgi:hypothetical protein
LEDTFAHTTGNGYRNWVYYADYPGFTSWIGYPDPEAGLGHAEHGHEPDWTWVDQQKAMKMAELVFNELRLLAKNCGGGCPAKNWSDIQGNVSSFMGFQPKLYNQFVYGTWIKNATFSGYDEKIRLLDSTFSLDPMYKCGKDKRQ